MEPMRIVKRENLLHLSDWLVTKGPEAYEVKYDSFQYVHHEIQHAVRTEAELISLSHFGWTVCPQSASSEFQPSFVQGSCEFPLDFISWSLTRSL